MAKVTPQDIQVFNERYYVCHNYAQIARETGFSSSTVRKYIIPNWAPPIKENIIEFNDSMFIPYRPQFEGVTNLGDLCVLSDEEREEMKNLWKELSV